MQSIMADDAALVNLSFGGLLARGLKRDGVE